MEELKLTFVNVGYGEAALLECPDPAFPGGTFVMVIDGGSAEAEEYRDSATGRIPLDQYLSLRGVDHIDLMAATHVHEDHLCGLLPAAEKLPPAALWQTLPPEFCRSMRTLDIPAEGLTPSRSKFLRALNDYRRLCLGQSCPRHRPLAGMELRPEAGISWFGCWAPPVHRRRRWRPPDCTRPRRGAGNPGSRARTDRGGGETW